MATTIRRVLSRAALPLVLIPGLAAQAQTEVAWNADGSVSVTVADREVTIPATIADEIIDALRENVDDPQGLQAAVQTIVAGNADGRDRTALASAVVAFAAFMSTGDSEAVAAIVNGATAGNPAVSTPELLGNLPETTVGAPPPPPGERSTADAPPPSGERSTAENPQQVPGARSTAEDTERVASPVG